MLFKEKINFVKKCYTGKRLKNAIKAEVSYYVSLLLKKSIVWGLPPILMVEPTNICNLKCPLCPSGTGDLNRPRGFMEFDVFKKVVDEVKDFTTQLVLWNQGEPFLNKDFLKMVRYASDNRLYTLTSTNLNVMPDPDELVHSGLDSMIVSLDGTTQETYNKYRINGELQTVMENVKKVVEAKKRANSATPYIRWQFLVMKHNEHELEEIKRIAHEVGVDQLELKSVQIYSKSDVEEFLPENPKYRRYKVSGNNFELKYGIKNRCHRIWTDPVVNWNGEIGICCFDKDVDHKVGNVMRQSLREIWTNAAFQDIRNHILKDRKSIPICRNCLEGVKIRIEENKA